MTVPVTGGRRFVVPDDEAQGAFIGPRAIPGFAGTG